MSDSTPTDPIDLSIVWSNESGFDNVRRLKFTRKFNNSTVETKILTRATDFEDGYFNNNQDGLSISFMIERNTANIGIHKLNMYYSMSDSGELWFDLIGKTLIQNITAEHVQQNFDELVGQSLAFSPTFEDTSGFVSGISGERLTYTIVNKLDVSLFDESPLEFVTGSGDAFVIRKDNQYLSVGTTGEISWVDVYESATPLYRVSMTMQDGVELKLIMNGKTTDDLLLYKSSANEPAKFIRFENITEQEKAHTRIIKADYSEFTYESQNPVKGGSWRGWNIPWERQNDGDVICRDMCSSDITCTAFVYDPNPKLCKTAHGKGNEFPPYMGPFPGHKKVIKEY